MSYPTAFREFLWGFPNVQGISNTLKPRVRESTGVTIPEEQCIRVYVSEKLPLVQLLPQFRIPSLIDEIPVDVYTSGIFRALQYKTDYIRPLKAGVSIGHKDITAGTYGWLYEKDEEGLGSNAHIVTPDPSKPTGSFKGDAILSPGPHDDNFHKVGEYLWHEQIHPSSVSDCGLSQGVARSLNLLSKGLHRKTRFQTLAETVNYLDFGIASKKVEVKLECFEFDPVDFGYSLAGHVYAGSNTIGGIIKANPHILNTGWKPVGVPVISEYKVGTLLRKSGRTSCDTRFRIIDESAQMNTNYGDFSAFFDDIALTENPEGKLIQPGDSGSSTWSD